MVRKKIDIQSILFVTGLLVVSACSSRGTIIRSEPPRASVAVNGVSQGITPIEVKLDCDKEDDFEIVVSAPGYQTQKQTIPCGMFFGPKKNVFFELEPGEEETGLTAVPAPPPQTAIGTLEVKSVPDQAEVYINGELLGSTPLTDQELKAGDYTVEVRKEGFASARKTIHITPHSRSSNFFILEMQ